MADKPILTKDYNEDLDVDVKMGEGGVYAKVYLGVQGNDLEAAKIALETMIDSRLNAEENIWLRKVSMFDILKDETETFSGVAEVEMVASDFRWFLNTIMRYGPSAVEIVEPADVTLTSDEMHSIVADIADFAHVYSQQIIEMLKDPERQALYEKMIGKPE